MKKGNILINNKSGFTLIELAVVVMIIGLMAALIIPQYAKQTDRARDGVARSELKAMQNAVELYFIENGNYPDSKEELEKALSDYGVTWPEDDPYNNEYVYYFNPGDSSGYYIFSRGSKKSVDGVDTVVYCSSGNEPDRGRVPSTESLVEIIPGDSKG